MARGVPLFELGAGRRRVGGSVAAAATGTWPASADGAPPAQPHSGEPAPGADDGAPLGGVAGVREPRTPREKGIFEAPLSVVEAALGDMTGVRGLREAGLRAAQPDAAVAAGGGAN